MDEAQNDEKDIKITEYILAEFKRIPIELETGKSEEKIILITENLDFSI